MVDACDAFTTYATVQTWLSSLQRQTRLAAPERQECLQVLAALCAYVGQAPDAIITACLCDTPDSKTIRSRSRQQYAAQIDAFQHQVPGGLRQQVQYGRIVQSFLIHNGVMLQAGWQYRPHSTSE